LIRAVIGLIRAAIRASARQNYPVTPQRSFLIPHDMNTCNTPRRHVIVTVHRSRHPVRPYLAAIVLAMGWSLAGCGDKGQDSTPAKTTSYQGKPDTAPWDGSPWNGDRASWERAITAREQNQNEYVRIP
jgi:hypothetical protein